MENKGPIIISYLSLIILIILLSTQVYGVIRSVIILVMLITETLMMTALIREEKWDYQSWYTFFVFMITLPFIITQMQPGASLSAVLSVEIIFSMMVGLFLTIFSNEEIEEDSPGVKVVDMEPNIEIIHEEPKEQKITEKKEEFLSTETGVRYHLQGCQIIKNTPKDKLVVYRSIRQAAGKGLKACKICIK